MSLNLLPCSLTHHWPSGKTWNKSIGPYFSSPGSWKGGGWEVIWFKHHGHKILKSLQSLQSDVNSQSLHRMLPLNEDSCINVSAGPREYDVHTDTLTVTNTKPQSWWDTLVFYVSPKTFSH